MIKTAEINSRLLEDLPVVRLPKFIPPGGGLSIWWMGDDQITFQAISADTNLLTVPSSAPSRRSNMVTP